MCGRKGGRLLGVGDNVDHGGGGRGGLVGVLPRHPDDVDEVAAQVLHIHTSVKRGKGR